MIRKKGRPKKLKKVVIVSLRFEADEYEKVQDIAALETINSGKIVSAHQLIRDAVSFVYGDNERLRECFRRSRAHITKKY
jgi:hypothetical protein